MARGSDVVVGVDIGTTATKAVAFDAEGRSCGSSSAPYPLEEPQDGWAVQDPDAIVDAVVQAVRRAVAAAHGEGAVVRGLACSGAMHSLLGLDADGRPLTPSITWADVRAAEQAERLRVSTRGAGLHRRTGTPVHAMSPLVKLVWFAEHDAATSAAARTWTGIKEYVLSRLTGELAVDLGTASGTGLLESTTLDWWQPALDLAQVRREQLPRVVAPTSVLGTLTPRMAHRLGVDEDVPVVVGGADGPLANLGLGAVRPGVAAISIGTSGGLRVAVDEPGVDERLSTFCYALAEDRWILGGAVNNGGSVLKWTGDALAPDSSKDPAELLLAEAADVPPGSEGLLMLPYLMGERAPRWSSLPTGAYVGLERSTRRGHLVRAAIEGVCMQLALVLRSVEEAGAPVHEVRATGGFARSPLWRQLLADVLGRPVGYAEQHEGSSLGAALLGMHALGMVDSLDAAADLVRIEETVEPDDRAAEVYRRLLPVYEGLADALEPTWSALRDLAPHLPAASR